jgi:hypothetical protein
VFANCDALKAMRTAKAGTADDGFDDYGTFAVVAPNGEVKLLDQYDRQQYIQMVAKAISNGQIVSDSLKRAQDRIRDVRDIKQLQSLGILDTDVNALYFGFVGVSGDAGDHILGVGGSTLVKGNRR